MGIPATALYARESYSEQESDLEGVSIYLHFGDDYYANFYSCTGRSLANKDACGIMRHCVVKTGV